MLKFLLIAFLLSVAAGWGFVGAIVINDFIRERQLRKERQYRDEK